MRWLLTGVLVALLSSSCTALLLQPGGRRHAGPRRVDAPRAALFKRRELEVGARWEGLILKITDFGFFVRMGHEQHTGLVHIKTLVEERLARDTVADFIESNVGPEGSQVSVEVLSLEYRGQKQTSLKLLEVVKQQKMEELVFAPGPRRQQGGYDVGDDEE